MKMDGLFGKWILDFTVLTGSGSSACKVADFYGQGAIVCSRSQARLPYRVYSLEAFA